MIVQSNIYLQQHWKWLRYLNYASHDYTCAIVFKYLFFHSPDYYMNKRIQISVDVAEI